MNPLMVSCQLKQSIIGAINVRTWRENIFHSYTPKAIWDWFYFYSVVALPAAKPPKATNRPTAQQI